MKRILSLVLVLLMVFSFAACKKGEPSATPSEAESSESTFVAPTNYASTVIVTINPKFKLYLDALGQVLAVEPLNKEAKNVAKNIDIPNGTLQAVIDNIVLAVRDGGFIKENTKVKVEVAEIKNDLVNPETLMNTVKETTDKSFKTIEATVDVSASIDEDIHIHKYSAATCTKVATCSCGATQGEKLAHKFSKGSCTVCGAADPNYKPPTTVANKKGSWVAEYVDKSGSYYKVTLTLVGTPSIGVLIGDPLSTLPQEAQNDIRQNKNEPGYKESYIVYKGKDYWQARGGSSNIKPFTENDDTLVLNTVLGDDGEIVLIRTGENTLTVKSLNDKFKSVIEDIPVGTKLTFKKQ